MRRCEPVLRLYLTASLITIVLISASSGEVPFERTAIDDSVKDPWAKIIADIDKDGGVERVRFYLANGTFYRGITNSGGNPASYAGQPETVETVATDVRNAAATPIFTYLDANGTELPYPIDLSEVVSVGFRLDVDLNPLRAPNVFTVTGTATLRNLPTE